MTHPDRVTRQALDLAAEVAAAEQTAAQLSDPGRTPRVDPAGTTAEVEQATLTETQQASPARDAADVHARRLRAFQGQGWVLPARLLRQLDSKNVVTVGAIAGLGLLASLTVVNSTMARITRDDGGHEGGQSSGRMLQPIVPRLGDPRAAGMYSSSRTGRSASDPDASATTVVIDPATGQQVSVPVPTGADANDQTVVTLPSGDTIILPPASTTPPDDGSGSDGAGLPVELPTTILAPTTTADPSPGNADNGGGRGNGRGGGRGLDEVPSVPSTTLDPSSILP